MKRKTDTIQRHDFPKVCSVCGLEKDEESALTFWVSLTGTAICANCNAEGLAHMVRELREKNHDVLEENIRLTEENITLAGKLMVLEAKGGK